MFDDPNGRPQGVAHIRDLSGRHEHFSSSMHAAALFEAARNAACQRPSTYRQVYTADDASHNSSKRSSSCCVAFELVQASRIPHVLVMKTMQVVARIENDERIVDMSCNARGLTDLGRCD